MPEVSGDLITRNYSNFRGVDFSNTEVALYRSPDAINMWKDYKKMGTSIETRPDIVLFKELKNTVYGLFFYTINQVDHMIIHCGVSLHDYNMKTKELKIIKEKGMNIRKSQSFIYRNILYIKDGLNYLQYDGETCKEVIGYIPITTIGKAPSGGGTTNQEVNLLTGVRENSFCADGESTEYVLDASELDAGYQEKVFINDVEKTEGFTVDKVSGKVKFTTAPEKPLTDGQDNVVIRFSKTIPGNRDKINKCTILEVFDNRVFFSGNQDYPNTVFHTMLDEPKYCSDLDYYNEGADISPVRGMVAGNNALWVIKEPSQANTAIFYHNPTIDSEAGKVYPSEHSSISTGCIGAAINFNDDIVYFSNRGMEGISGDITTEQVISHRSSLVDSKLLQEENYKDMILVEYEGYLLVIIKDKIYLADSRAMFTNENHNEYEWFYWNIDIEPTCAVVYNGELWLGSKQGIFKIGKASENNKEISMEKDEEERYFIDGVTKQETGTESYKTVTGKEILIEDGENNKGLEIKVKGSTSQATRSGKNIYNKGNVSGTLYKEVPINELPAGTYTLSAVVTSSDTDRTQCLVLDATNNKNLGYLSRNVRSSLTFTLEKPTKKLNFYASSTYNLSEGDTFKFADIQIEQGTTATEYEQYGASPSPDYPAKIENVEGKNKFNKSNMTEATWDNGKTNTVTLLEDGRIQSTANYAQWAAKCIDIPNLKANTNYVVSGKIVSSTAGNTMITVKGYKNNTLSNIIYRQYAVGTKFELSFNSSDYEKIGISISGNNSTLETIYTTIFDEIQLEEGTIATSYVPYNSLEIKDIGENLFDKKTNTILTWLTAAEITEEGSVCSKNFIPTTKNKIYATNFAACVFYYDKKLNYLGNSMDLRTDSGKSYTTWTNPDNNNIAFMKVEYRKSFSNNLDMTTQEIMLTESGIVKPYKPYQAQKVDFPLSEGQKLYEGSYLADDGIHNKRKQIVLNGTEGIANVYVNTSTTRFGFSLSLTPDKKIGLDNVLSTHFKCDTTVYYDSQTQVGICGNARNVNIYIRVNGNITTDEFKTWLATQYANGTPVIIEYELATEEIVPYTTAQQEAGDKIESMKLYDGVNHIESTSEIDIKYNYIYKKPSIKNKSNIENKISSGEYQTIINNKRYFVFLEEELKSVRNDITDRLYIDTNKNIAKVMKRVDKLVLNGTEEWNVNATHSNVFYTAKPKNMADNETNIFCTITDEFSKDLSGETYGILIDTNINIKIPKVKTVADLKAYLAKEPITIQYKATEEIKDIILLSKPSSYWTTCEDEFKYPQMQKTTNKRGCVADVIGEEIEVFCKTNKEQFEKIATNKNATGYAVNRIKKKKWKSIQLKFSSNKSFELFSCTLESYIGSYIKR